MVVGSQVENFTITEGRKHRKHSMMLSKPVKFRSDCSGGTIMMSLGRTLHTETATFPGSMFTADMAVTTSSVWLQRCNMD